LYHRVHTRKTAYIMVTFRFIASFIYRFKLLLLLLLLAIKHYKQRFMWIIKYVALANYKIFIVT